MAETTLLGCIVRIICCHKCRKKNPPQADTTPANVAMEYNPGNEAIQKPTPSASHVGGVFPGRAASNNYTYEGCKVPAARVVSHESGAMVVAIYDYNPTSQEDLQFKKGDRLTVLDKSDGDWWEAILLTTKRQGFIPSNYVADMSTVHCEEWFHGQLLRQEAEKLLLNSETGNGTFLIRASERVTGGYALSLLFWDKAAKRVIIKHYAINVSASKYTIDNKVSFSSLQELVKHYSEDHSVSRLATTLTTPCRKPEPQLWDLSSATKGNWEINRSEVKMEKMLGEGHYGQVWLGKYLGKSSVQVAIKTLKPGTMTPEAFMAEATIMKTLHHKNLVSLYAVCSKEEPILIITEYIPNGSLLDFLKNKESSKSLLPLSIQLYMAEQIASGMFYLESHQRIHRDLAARNILVGNNNLVKIADFGLARVLDDEIYQIHSKTNLPTKWTAPEVFMYHECSTKSDVWSFGIVLMEIVTYGASPYKGMSNTDVKSKVLAGYRMPRPSHHPCPESLYDLMIHCWEQEPDKRPSFEYLQAVLNEFDVNKQQYG